MKINEVIISEQPVAGTQQPAMYKPADTTFATNYSQRNRAGFVPNVATTKPGGGQAPQPAPKKKPPKKQAPKKPVDAMANSYAGDQQTSNYTGAVQKSPEPAPEVDPSLDPYDPAKDTNVTQVADPGGTTAELDRLKQLAIGGQQPAPAAQAAPAAGQRPGGIAFNQDAGTTSGQAAQPEAPAPEAPAPVAQAAAPAPEAPSTVAPVVKTGSGGTLTTRDGKPVTSRSADEIAWAQKNPYQPYPGPGWQEKQKAQGDANAAAVKGFLNKINPFAKKAAPAAPGTPAAGAAFNQGAPVTMESGELNDIRRLSGLR
jgi:hypothetical protein